MKLAYCLIRHDPVYRREAFVLGLRACGFTVVRETPPFHTAGNMHGDVMVIWNRYNEFHDMATRFEQRGGTVIVAENAYVALDRSNRMRYAVALGGHNGQGCWPMGGPHRWQALGLALAPWRTAGAHVLVCPNRSFGTPGRIMPTMWPEDIVRELKRYTNRPIRIRPHPGNDLPKVPLINDLRNAWAVVVWSSSAGCEALLHGIPVYACCPFWIAKEAACKGGLKTIDNPALTDRQPVFERLAWAQWHVDEITSGEAFKALLESPVRRG